MTLVIATSGKGGTGKTTTAAAIVRCLVESGTRPVLAVDADANSTLNEALGVSAATTVGGAREDFHDEQDHIPSGMTKEAYLEFKLSGSVIEGDDVDMLVMGRPEGSGCYCYANNILRNYVEKLQGNYPAVVIDNEAGLEHLSRKTTRRPDVLLIVSDHARRGIEAARRVRDLVEELHLEVGRVMLVVNQVPASGLDPLVRSHAEECGLLIAATLPDDPEVLRADMEHRSVFTLKADNPFLSAVRDLTRRLAGGGE